MSFNAGIISDETTECSAGTGRMRLPEGLRQYSVGLDDTVFANRWRSLAWRAKMKFRQSFPKNKRQLVVVGLSGGRCLEAADVDVNLSLSTENIELR